MITLTFDDCYKSQKKETQTLFQQTGIKASFYVITDYIKNENIEYMKIEDLLELVQAGHEIGSHTVSHPRLSNISKEQCADEIVRSKKILENLGIPVTTFVYPYGRYTAEVMQEVQKAGYTCARSTKFGFNTRSSNKYALVCQPVYRWIPFFLITYWIRKAERKNLWLILMFHQLDYDNNKFYGSTPEICRKVIQYLHAKKIKTVTMQEGRDIVFK